MTTVEVAGSEISATLIARWGKVVYFFLGFSILLLGIGHFQLPFSGARFSAWSISRTTFFFWLIWKSLIWFRLGRQKLGLHDMFFPLPLLTFLVGITASLLPDFHEADDYRYLFFAVMHCLMILDLFAAGERTKLLLIMLGLLPGVLVIRGIVYDPSVLNLSGMNRFGYPISHPNSAGLIFAMSIPLALTIIVNHSGWLRRLTLLSLAAQFGGLALTYSRGAWLGCVVSLVAISLLEKSLRKSILTLGFISLVAFLTVVPLRNRLLTLIKPKGDLSIGQRLEVMADALTVGLGNPFLGVGYGRDRLREGVKKESLTPVQVGFISHSHNLYTELLAETGVLGLGAFLWMILANLSRLIRRARSELTPSIRTCYSGLGASLIAFLVSVLADAPFYNHDTRIFFFTLLALTYLFLRPEVPVRSAGNN
jgi:O-antigen ligase